MANKPVKELKVDREKAGNDGMAVTMRTMVMKVGGGAQFYASYFAQMKRVEDPRCPSAGVCFGNTGPELHYNRAWWESLTPEQREYVLKHEVLHNMLLHHMRAGWVIDQRDNIAMDLAVNSILGKPPLTGCYPGIKPFKDMPHGKSYEEYWKLLEKHCKPRPKPGKDGDPQAGDQQGEGEGGGQSDGQDQGGKDPRDMSSDQDKDAPHLDDWAHKNRKASAQDNPSGEMINRGMVERAVKDAKLKGDMPAELEEIIKGYLTKKPNWKRLVRVFIGEIYAIASRATYLKANRMYRHLLGIVPGHKDECVGRILVGLDTSGSMTKEIIAQLIGQLSTMPVPYDLVQCDAMCHGGPKTIRNPRKLEMSIKGGGGTDFRPVFEMAVKKGYTGVIYLTDMCGTFPDSYNKPCLWVAYDTKEKGPFGKTIFVEKDGSVSQ